jgi:hypothetical protein
MAAPNKSCPFVTRDGVAIANEQNQVAYYEPVNFAGATTHLRDVLLRAIALRSVLSYATNAMASRMLRMLRATNAVAVACCECCDVAILRAAALLLRACFRKLLSLSQVLGASAAAIDTNVACCSCIECCVLRKLRMLQFCVLPRCSCFLQLAPRAPIAFASSCC